MIAYVARRVLVSIPTLIGVATVIFLLVHLLPGDPARVIAGVNATPADVERIRHQLALDQPGWQQYLTFMARLAHGDLGTSTHTLNPVTSEIGARAPYTAELAAVSILIAVAAGVAAGVVAATRRNTLLDVLISTVAIAGVSIPVYWLGLMLVVVFAVDLRVLPAAGAAGPASIVLPAVTLASFSVGFIARQTRSAMLEVLGQDFVRTARAKGAGESAVLLKHALRNAMLPIVTTVGLQFGTLLGGAVLTETVFAWPGIGRLLVDSIFFRDFPVVQGVVLVIAVAFIVVNLLTDLVYAVVDPRIRYG
jgi:ABC-type dipeptide/oligopeptide/nickel transport system permease component